MSVIAIVYSMDRAMQLDSLLRSIDDLCEGVSRMVVLMRASSDLHVRAYQQLSETKRTTQVSFVSDEGCLGEVLRAEVEKADETRLALHVDDQVYFRRSDFRQAEAALDSGAFVWSWRLGAKPFCTAKGDAWQAHDVQDRDYSYLWHSDGAVYDRKEWLDILDRVDPFWHKHCGTPNAVEALAATTRVTWRPGRIHAGPSAATTMTFQINKEQTTTGKYGAPWHTIKETELDAMAKAFLEGKRVNNRALYADRSWTRRFTRGPQGQETHVRACLAASQFYTSLIK